jgi:hypothetical protein
MNFEGWTITKSTHGMDCHKCEWAVEAAVSESVVRGSVGCTYTFTSLAATHSATVTRDNEEGTR